jgi:ferritin-like metal-binding protein YciE
MKDPKEILAEWLRDAHAMESNQITMLKKQSGSLAAFPALQLRVADHAEQSRRHAELVENCLKSIGEDTRVIKQGLGKISAMASQLTASMSDDEPVKIVLANTAVEHFEIACYRSLQVAANHCGETEIAQAAAQILREEEIMAGFLEGEIEDITRVYLETEASVGSIH